MLDLATKFLFRSLGVVARAQGFQYCNAFACILFLYYNNGSLSWVQICRLVLINIATMQLLYIFPSYAV